jgi:hypothetical protein
MRRHQPRTDDYLVAAHADGLETEVSLSGSGGTDQDNDVLTYSLGTVTPAPAGGNSDPLTMNAATGLFTWTPLAADVKSFSISEGNQREIKGVRLGFMT